MEDSGETVGCRRVKCKNTFFRVKGTHFLLCESCRTNKSFVYDTKYDYCSSCGKWFKINHTTSRHDLCRICLGHVNAEKKKEANRKKRKAHNEEGEFQLTQKMYNGEFNEPVTQSFVTEEISTFLENKGQIMYLSEGKCEGTIDWGYKQYEIFNEFDYYTLLRN